MFCIGFSAPVIAEPWIGGDAFLALFVSDEMIDKGVFVRKALPVTLAMLLYSGMALLLVEEIVMIGGWRMRLPVLLLCHVVAALGTISPFVLTLLETKWHAADFLLGGMASIGVVSLMLTVMHVCKP